MGRDENSSDNLKGEALQQSMKLIKELEEARNRLNITANALPAFVAYVSPDERYQFTNNKYTDWFGLSSNDLYGQKLIDVLGPDTYGRSKPFIDRALKGEAVTFETQLTKANKKHKIIVSYIPDINAETRQVRGFALMGQDVTTLREAQIATEVSESRFRTIFQQSPLPIQLHSLDGVCTDANEAWSKLWEADVNEVRGYNLFEDVQLKEKGILKELKQAFTGKHIHTPPIEYKPEESENYGRSRWVETFAFPVIGTDGQISEVALIHEDVTDRVKSLQLQERLTQQAQLLSQASEILFSSLDYQNTLSSLSRFAVPQFADWCSVDIADENGHLNLISVTHTDESKVGLAHELRRRYPAEPDASSGTPKVFRTGVSELYPQVSDEVLKMVTKEDEWRFQTYKDLGFRSAMLIPIKHAEKTLGVISFINSENSHCFDEQDLSLAEEIARRAAIAIENAQSYSEAQAANRAKTHFLANMSHEIRTPLAAILGYTELLSDPNTTEPEKNRFIKIIDRSGKALTQLIDDILDLSKVEAGRLRIEEQNFNLQDFLDEVISLFHAQAMEKGIDLVSEICKKVPDYIRTDSFRLRQILINIVGNALKFTSHGEVRIKVSCQESELCFFVIDTGIGMSKEQGDRLFEPFTQGDNSSTRRFGGTGLGLTLSRELARALGGDVSLVECHPNEGCTFLARILMQAHHHQPIEITSAPIKKTSLEGVRILLVDDSQDNRLLVNTMLSRLGAKIQTATNGEEGVQSALSDHFDLVLMDIQMPILDGNSATQKLRSLGYQQPIIALTAHAMNEERDRCIQSGCNDHVTKPVDFSLLTQKIQQFVHGPQKH